MVTTKKTRAIAKPGTRVGLTRYTLYKRAWEHVDVATKAGFHLEAITLLESILTDRMESRASFLTSTIQGYQNLGPLITTLKKHEKLPEFLAVLDSIDAWREQRNAAVHEMVKFEAGHAPTWDEKLKPLPKIVLEGKRIIRAFDRIDKRERLKNGARRAATEPAAFSDG
jgi:hypothetical protein